MPNVNPCGSSPPVSGNVEDPQHLHKLYQAQTVTHVINRPSAARSRAASSDNTPHPGLPEQRRVLHRVEVKDGPAQPSTREEKTPGDEKRSRHEVIKEISSSSSAFIGPTCRPQSAIEHELGEFYKELEQIDTVDGNNGGAGVNRGVSQSYAPPIHPSGRRNYHINAYRPYPATRLQQWRPQSHDMTYSYQNQWQLPPQCFQFHGPQYFFPAPPPGNPTRPLYYSVPQGNQCSQVESSGWRTHFPLGYDVGLASSHTPGLYEGYERKPSDLRRYEEQNYRDEVQRVHSDGTPSVLVLMRGVPGSGKSTLAREILSSGPSGLILSTDDYFYQEQGYVYEPTLLGHAHDWNQMRAQKSMLEGRTPVIIDNTNVQAWEMKPYVSMALEAGYRVEFVEPDTCWKCDPAELEKRNKHGVPRETIAKMLDRFELPMSVDIVMNSCPPPHKSDEHHSGPHGQKR